VTWVGARLDPYDGVGWWVTWVGTRLDPYDGVGWWVTWVGTSLDPYDGVGWWVTWVGTRHRIGASPIRPYEPALLLFKQLRDARTDVPRVGIRINGRLTPS